jgi:hypothetical protein
MRNTPAVTLERTRPWWRRAATGRKVGHDRVVMKPGSDGLPAPGVLRSSGPNDRVARGGGVGGPKPVQAGSRPRPGPRSVPAGQPAAPPRGYCGLTVTRVPIGVRG